MLGVRLHTVIILCATVLVVSIGLWMWSNVQVAGRFPLRLIAIVGAHKEKAAVQETLLPLVEHGFFAVDLEAVRSQLLAMPWIDKVSVRKVWSDRLVIRIVEKQPLARWGQAQLFDEQGHLFTPAPSTIPDALPQLTGPTGSAQQVLRQYQALRLHLAPLGLQVTSVTLTDDYAWQVGLSNAMQLRLGRSEIAQRLQRFIKVYPQMFASVPKGGVDYVDLRYANGMAVRWRDH